MRKLKKKKKNVTERKTMKSIFNTIRNVTVVACLTTGMLSASDLNNNKLGSSDRKAGGTTVETESGTGAEGVVADHASAKTDAFDPSVHANQSIGNRFGMSGTPRNASDIGDHLYRPLPLNPGGIGTNPVIPGPGFPGGGIGTNPVTPGPGFPGGGVGTNPVLPGPRPGAGSTPWPGSPPPNMIVPMFPPYQNQFFGQVGPRSLSVEDLWYYCCGWKETKNKYKPDAPDVIPSVGRDLRLQMLSGGDPIGFEWGKSIGFGPKRSLNRIYKLHLSSDERFVRIYVPWLLDCGTFELDETVTEEPTYRLVANQTYYPTDCTVVLILNDTNPEVVDFAELRFPDQRLWKFELETDQAAIGYTPGMVFRIIEDRDRSAYSTAFLYTENDVTITDASGTSYVCGFDETTKWINRIEVLGRSWDYAIEYVTGGEIVTETNNQTGMTIATTVAMGSVTKVEIRGADGTEDVEIREYTSKGFLDTIIRNGVVTDVEEHIDSAGNLVRWEAIGTQGQPGYVESELTMSEWGVIKSVNGCGEVTLFERDRFYNALKITKPSGREITNTYDENGYLVATGDSGLSGTSYELDERGNVMSMTQNGQIWNYEYNFLDRLIKRIAPNGCVTHYVRGVNGLPTYIVNKVSSTPDDVWQATYHEYDNMALKTFRSDTFYVTDP